MIRASGWSVAFFAASIAVQAGQTPAPKTHRLEAKPVLRIAAGDIIDVDTLLTNTPNGLQNAGVAPEKIQRERNPVTRSK